MRTTIFISSDYEAIANITVNNNKLLGGDYCVVSQGTAFPVSGISVTNNRMDDWVIAPFFVANNIVVGHGNVDNSSGAPIAAPPTPGVTVGVLTVAGQAATLSYSSGASLGDWPDVTNTGVQDGITLTPVNPAEYDGSGNWLTTTNGQLIENKEALSTSIIVLHEGVTIRNCHCRHVAICSSAARNLTVEYCWVDGNNGQRHNNVIGPVGWYNDPIDLGDDCGLHIHHCNIEGSELGIVLDTCNDALVEHNFIHNLTNTSNPDPHYDGIQPNDTQRVTIYHNTFDTLPNTSSPITMANGDNGLMDSNLFGGGGYTLYFNTGSVGWTVSNNWFRWCVVGWCGFSGFGGDSDASNQTWVQNRYGTGAPQNGAPPGGNAGTGSRPSPFP